MPPNEKTDAAEILADLNEPQREAVTHGEGPLLVVAGAGSGKTRVVTRRVAWLVAGGLSPRSILAITFTNKAANEMKERVAALVPGSGAWVSTFHSFCARLLRINGEVLGLPREYTIYDTEDTTALLKGIVAEKNLDAKSFRPAMLRSAVSRLKNEMVPADAAPAHDFRSRVIAEVYAAYEQVLRRNAALDFDDLLLWTVRLLREHDEVRARWRERFRQILVDEYQDTNAAQYAMIKLLGEGGNVCATGDPDQAIYGWRGADLRNILEFSRDFPGAKVVRLEQNYRSTGNVLKAAGALITKNNARLERGLWTAAAAGEPVRLIVAGDEEAEALEIAAGIERRVRAGRNYKECGVFYRTNAQSRALEMALLGHGVPYSIYGGVAFYQRREVKDVLAYLRLLLNPADDVAFRRAANVPRRGIGPGTLEKLAAEAAKRGLSLRAAAANEEVRGALPRRAAEALGAFAGLLEALAALLAESTGAEEIVRETIQRSGYEKSLDPELERDRIENLGELVSAADSYDFENPEGGLSGFLELAALYADIDGFKEQADRVSLMTLHSAKGLEFPFVFIAGLEERLLPHVRSFEDARRGVPHAVEEERRLLYVGITRAKESATLLFARERRLGGSPSPMLPSRFLKELGEEAVEKIDRTGAGFPSLERERPRAEKFDDWEDPPRRRRVGGEFSRVEERGSGVRVEYEPGAFADEEPGEFSIGDRVRHAKFGLGTVLEVDGTGPGARVVVKFDRYGRKRLALEFAKLRPAR